MVRSKDKIDYKKLKKLISYLLLLLAGVLAGKIVSVEQLLEIIRTILLN